MEPLQRVCLCSRRIWTQGRLIDYTLRLIQTKIVICILKGTVHEKPFFPGKGALGPSKYESGKKIRIKIKQGAQNWQ